MSLEDTACSKVQVEQPESPAKVNSYESNTPNAKLGIGLLGKYPVLSIVAFALVGIGTGYGLSAWDPSNEQAKQDAVRWVGLIGEMFLRMLKCLVLPLVFSSVILSVVDMLRLGKARKVVLSTLGLYFTTTVLAAIIGVVTSIIFKNIFIVDVDSTDVPPGRVAIACDSSKGWYMTRFENGTIVCRPKLDAAGSAFNQTNPQEFWLEDLDGSFVPGSGEAVRNDVSLSDTIYEGVFEKLISENLLADFVAANFGAVIVFASAFGVALHRATKQMEMASIQREGTGSTLLYFFRELEKTLVEMIEWVLMLTPFAVWSLIANGLGKNDDLVTAFINVGYLVLATLTGFSLHFLLVYCGLFILITRSNPFKYMKFLVPAQIMAFASASSAATIPVNLQCVINSKRVKPYVAKFVTSLGATVNMDATAVYMIIGMTFLAVTSGLGDQMNAATYILMAIIATIGSAGTAPVPSASLVLILTAYSTVFNTSGTPDSFSFILAIDWLLDRFRTVLNVTGDAVVCRMVSHIAAGGDDEEDYDKQDDRSLELEAGKAEAKVQVHIQ